ncbi:GspE/PulE family protein [Patescibacteria group bacterium]|nr:GspE/PulE family protein [Patescibacteria group bacterium]MCG2698769.1 GspE/PulE family protein [Candidatus Parcubacteria bacterium]MBU4014795.1 GspE/PulE family protein [Patescibacteria group bacterium]MBU4026268.1 GspE/PulE family protein [Patescibacteria group bacterium]MBU4125160.1 GspE/PulE family protein [Patescibacteria group bacterium]
MPDNKKAQSIEDLIFSSENYSDEDENAQQKFSKKQNEINKKDIERITMQKAASQGLPYIGLVGFAISLDALSVISEAEAIRLSAVCFYYDGEKIRIGSTNPENIEIKNLLDKLKEKYHCQGTLYLISENSLNFAFILYKNIPNKRVEIKGVQVTEEELSKHSEKFSSFKDLQEQINKAELTEMVSMILAAAIKANASDIHIEGEEKAIKVRFRVDGILHDSAVLGKEAWKRLISRMKMLAGVKINVSDRPQDGRVSIYLKNERIDIRASFLPTSYGESVVMRLLRSSTVRLEFEELGIRGQAFKQLEREILRPNGMIVTTGPTGSGKTTTLYAILKKLNNQETKIITIEDPIEYQMDGVNQSQISDKYTFAKGLRSIVRQDPDIILVGEIRDLETAEIAIQAALTGHLVLSTIHTNDAAGTVPRFLSMGAKPFLLAPSINAVVGQRLVRKICGKCKKEAKISPETMDRIKENFDQLPPEEKKALKGKISDLKFYEADGCQKCQGIGYRGRIGIYEIMIMSSELEKIILSGNVSEYDMRAAAAKNGMVTMAQDGLLKALDGITSVDEVFRVAK